MLLCLCAFSKAVLEFSGHGLHVTHSTCACCPATLGFKAPIELSHFLVWISTTGARRLLNMKADFATAATSCVRLVVTLSE